MATARARAFFVWLMLYGALSLAASVSAAPFVSPKGYQLTAPDGWQSIRNFEAADVALTAPPVNGFTSNFNVTTKSGPTATAEQVRSHFDAIKTQFNVLYARIRPGSKIISQAQATVNGSPALDTTLDYNQPVTGSSSVPLRIRQIVVFRPGKVFTLTCTTSQALHTRYDAVFDAIINSIQWTDGTGPAAPPAAAAETTTPAFRSPNGYQITPPAGWTAEVSHLEYVDLSLARSVQGQPVARLRIVVRPNPSQVTLEDFRRNINMMFPRDFSHYKLVSQDYFKLDGARALGTKFTNTNKEGEMVLVRQIDSHKNGQSYIITFAMPYADRAEYETVFTDMIKSFHWTP